MGLGRGNREEIARDGSSVKELCASGDVLWIVLLLYAELLVRVALLMRVIFFCIRVESVTGYPSFSGSGGFWIDGQGDQPGRIAVTACNDRLKFIGFIYLYNTDIGSLMDIRGHLRYDTIRYDTDLAMDSYLLHLTYTKKLNIKNN